MAVRSLGRKLLHRVPRKVYLTAQPILQRLQRPRQLKTRHISDDD